MKTFLMIAFLTLLTGCPQQSNSGGNNGNGGNNAPKSDTETETTETKKPEVKTVEDTKKSDTVEEQKKPVTEEETTKEETTTVVQVGPALLQVSVSEHDFGSKDIGSSSTFDVKITNVGEKPARTMSYEGLIAPFTLSLGTCKDSGTLKPGEFCSIRVKYDPAKIGTVLNSFDVSYYSTESNQSQEKVSVAFKGQTKLVLSSISKSSGLSGTEVTLGGKNFTADTQVKVGGSTCSISAQSQTAISCNVPNKAIGAYDVVVSEAGLASSLTGAFTYVSSASLDLDVTSHDFGQTIYQNTETVRITITNNGEFTASELVFSGLANQFSVSETTCDSELEGSQSCTVDIAYTPDGLSLDSDTLLVDYFDGNTSGAASVSVSGEGIERVVQVSSGSQTTCALYNTGNVKCWGQGAFGMLGNGGTANSSTPVSVIGVTTAVQISVSYPAVCAVLADGTVKCWGQVYYPNDVTNHSTPVTLAGVTNAKQVSVGYSNSPSCVAHNDGTVKCWGENDYEQLGDGTTTDRTNPVLVNDGAMQADNILVGESYACANDSGSLYCWGRNYRRTIDATADVSNIFSPTYVTNATGFDSFQAGGMHWCGLSGVDLWCQGGDDYGQIGDNAVNSPGFEDLFMTLTGVSDFTTGFNTCAIVNGGVKCWGNNQFGQNGNNTIQNGQNFDTNIQGITTAVKLSKYGAGVGTVCAILENAAVKCWGRNSSGQLGDGTLVNSNIPVTVQGLYP